MSPTSRNYLRIATGCVALIPVLAACTPTPEPEPEPSTTPVPPPTSTSSSPSSTTPSSTVNADGLAKDVAEVYEQFASLAPLELFQQFDTCDPNGVENSSACTGSEVGQFQFFDNSAKAASTTQLLTELRSSRVVEDSGSRIVGWTTMGTMSIITVVDNDEGLVMQQMVSSDRIDPEDLIYELGLVKEPTDPTDVTETTNVDKD